MTASIPASDLTSAGAYNIIVFNPTPGGGTSNAQTLTVNPEQIQTIVGKVDSLVKDEILEQGNGNALTSKLEAAEQQSNRGNPKTAINSLQAFINQVNAFVKSRKLTPEIGQLLIDSANRMIAQLTGN